jgi:hypothetical protein
MKDPVSGVFRVTDWYDAHPHSSPPGTTLTGVIVADGIAPTPAEARADHKGKWSGHNELPITVDRADPSNFRIEWDQVVVNDWQATARQRANEAASRLAAGQGQVGGQSGSGEGGVGSGGVGTAGAGLSGAGDLNSLVQQALRSAGMDPGILNSGNRTVHVETTFGTATPGQAGEMMAGFFGGGSGGVGGGSGVGGQFGSFGQAGQAGSFGQAGQAGSFGQAGQAGSFGQGMTVAATGVVRAAHDVAPVMPLPAGMSQADLTLDVMRPDGSTYAATTRLGFRSPARRAAIATVGTELPVLVDPNDPGRLTIDLAKLNLP